MPLIPVVCFGEKFSTKTVPFRPAWLRRTLLRMRLSGVGFIGRWNTLMPRAGRPFGWVFGRPIAVDKKSVEELHKEFLHEMERIFEQYKGGVVP